MLQPGLLHTEGSAVKTARSANSQCFHAVSITNGQRCEALCGESFHAQLEPREGAISCKECIRVYQEAVRALKRQWSEAS